jgi:hypothetical protein
MHSSVRAVSCASILLLGGCVGPLQLWRPEPQSFEFPAPFGPKQVAFGTEAPLSPGVLPPTFGKAIGGTRSEATRADGLRSLLADLRHYAGLDKAELDQEYKRVKRRFSRSKTSADRLRWAWLLSLPNSANRDEQLALKLLEDKHYPRSELAMRDLSFLMRSLISRGAAERQALRETSQRLKSERARAGALEGKIEAFTNIEQKITDRQTPAIPAPQ